MKTAKAKVSRADRLAKKIGEVLFTNGTGQSADRLLMIREANGSGVRPFVDLGGWSQKAMVDRIRQILNEDGVT